MYGGQCWAASKAQPLRHPSLDLTRFTKRQEDCNSLIPTGYLRHHCLMWRSHVEYSPVASILTALFDVPTDDSSGTHRGRDHKREPSLSLVLLSWQLLWEWEKRAMWAHWSEWIGNRSHQTKKDQKSNSSALQRHWTAQCVHTQTHSASSLLFLLFCTDPEKPLQS